jgi:hypothetical protein
MPIVKLQFVLLGHRPVERPLVRRRTAPGRSAVSSSAGGTAYSQLSSLSTKLANRTVIVRATWS